MSVIIKYHRMSVLNHINLFLTVLEADQTKIKVKAVSVPCENSLPSLQTANTLSPCCYRQKALGSFIEGHQNLRD